NNNCTNNYNGIGLDNCAFSTVTNNTCNNNDRNGIGLGASNYSIVADNTCNHNYYGIEINHASNNTISWNILVGNEVYGIGISDNSASNVIHHNDFIVNGQDTSQACDNGRNNQWYDETVLEGNYWFDYSGNGSYIIAGSAEASDPYPSLSPYRYIPKQDSSSSPQSILVRVGLFLGVIGLLGVILFVNRWRKASYVFRSKQQ
ncbi:MAG: NosD domain-containing protein, partial [Candidatus Thorarchaeota archaeon]